jgi:hypothetical protein
LQLWSTCLHFQNWGKIIACIWRFTHAYFRTNCLHHSGWARIFKVSLHIIILLFTWKGRYNKSKSTTSIFSVWKLLDKLRRCFWHFLIWRHFESISTYYCWYVLLEMYNSSYLASLYFPLILVWEIHWRKTYQRQYKYICPFDKKSYIL